MIGDIKDTIKKQELNKTKSVAITLSKKILNDLVNEMKRLGIKSRSFMIEMILENYFQMPITEELNKKKKGEMS